MSTKSSVYDVPSKVSPITTKTVPNSQLLQQYGCGAIRFDGTEDALYDRHLVFDRAIDPKVASARERFEAFSRSVRDVLAQRWVLTKSTYEQQNAKRIYYLSMEFLIGRSLANNITNLLLDPIVRHATQEWRVRANASRHFLIRCATSWRSAGCKPRPPTSNRMPSASTIFRWSSLLDVR